jgi:hypothetical protein
VNRTLASVPLLLVAFALAACAPTPPPGATPADPRPTPPSTATPIPVPTVTLPPEDLDPLDTVTRLLLETGGVSFCDASTCTIDGFDFETTPHGVAAAKLAVVFGADPLVERSEAEEGGEAVYYTWDSFRLYYVVGEGLIGRNLGVSVDAANVHGVAVETLHGVRVGTPVAEAAALADVVFTGYGEYEMRFDTMPDPVYPADFFVAGYGAEDGSGAVLTLTAPIWASAE